MNEREQREIWRPKNLLLEQVEIQPGFNPKKFRRDANYRALVESIKNIGVITPIIVRKSIDNADVYWIVSGERRYRAAKELGLSSILADVLELDDQQAEAFAATENQVLRRVL